MVKYTDVDAMLRDGIVKKLETPLPNCVEIMKREFVEYVVGECVTCNYPVFEMYSNPRKAMQGGFISAAFDNTFGLLVYLITGQIEMASLDLCINYHCPIYENDVLTVTTHIKSRGKRIIHQVGDAYDSKRQLIASGTSSIYLPRKERREE
ncbi:MAG: PaaI family thioesterase [Syntrophomonas sp.]